MNFLQEVNRYHILNAQIRRNKGPNIERVGAVSHDDRSKNFRLSENEMKLLAQEFYEWRGKGCYTSAEKRVEAFICMMASGGFYRQIGHTVGLAKNTIFEHTHEVVEFLVQSANKWIKLPSENEYGLISSPILLHDGTEKDAVLFLDGSIMKISRPDHANDSYYCGRAGKHCDSINVQFVVDKKGRIRHVLTGLSGKIPSNVIF